jgi:hypothetical protein
MLPYNLAGGGPFRGHMWGSAEFLDTKSRSEGHTMVAACGFWCRGWGLYFCTLVSGAGLFVSSVQVGLSGAGIGWHTQKFAGWHSTFEGVGGLHQLLSQLRTSIARARLLGLTLGI